MRLKAKAIFAWYDLWVGLYYDRKGKELYIFPIPMFGIKTVGRPQKALLLKPKN